MTEGGKNGFVPRFYLPTRDTLFPCGFFYLFLEFFEDNPNSRVSILGESLAKIK
jgi:hypothetical protein